MNARNLIIGIPVGLLALAALLLFIEAFSISPRYELEPATIRSVGPDATGMGGFVGETERTLIRFDDGLTDYMGGRRGEPGERILAPRRRGTSSALGILAQRR